MCQGKLRDGGNWSRIKIASQFFARPRLLRSASPSCRRLTAELQSAFQFPADLPLFNKNKTTSLSFGGPIFIDVDIVSESWNTLRSWVFEASEAILAQEQLNNSYVYR